MFCKNCGKEISDKAVVCVACGCSAVENKKGKPKKIYRYSLHYFVFYGSRYCV